MKQMPVDAMTEFMTNADQPLDDYVNFDHKMLIRIIIILRSALKYKCILNNQHVI